MNAGDFETLERVVGDISHTSPIVTGFLVFISKYVEKQKMSDMLRAGQHQLHLAITVLEHKCIQKLLKNDGIFAMLMENYELSVFRRFVTIVAHLPFG